MNLKGLTSCLALAAAVLTSVPAFISVSYADVSGPADSLAGVVHGVVVSADSRLPLSGASVRIDGSTRAAETDSAGGYSFTHLRSGTYDIHVSHVGYEAGRASAVINDARLSVRVDVALKRVAIPLKDITVTPGRFTLMESAPAVHQSLSREDIATIPQMVEDIYRAVARIPGINTSDFSARFAVRGGEHDQVLVLLDGLELYEPFHLKDVDGGALSILDVATIDGVDLITGGFPAQYGNRMSGVFNIETRHVTPDTRRAEVGISLTAIRALGEGTFGNNRGSWLLSARRGYVDLVTPLTSEYKDIKPRYHDVMGKVSWRLGARHTLSGHVLHASDDLDFNYEGEVAETMYRTSYGWWRFQAQPSDQLAAQTVLSIGQVNHARSGDGHAGADAFAPFAVDEDRRMKSFGIATDFRWELTERIMLSWGGAFSRLNSDYDYRSTQLNRYALPGGGFILRQERTEFDQRFEGDSFGGWISGRVQPLALVTLEAGVRYDRVSFTEDRLVSPRAGVLVALSEQTSIRAAWGKYYQPQKMYELDIVDADYTFYPAELAEHYVVGVERQFDSGTEARVEAYYKDLSRLKPDYRNFLDAVQLFPEAYMDRTRINRASGVSRGIEFYFRRDRGGRFGFWGSYVLSSSTEYVTDYDYEGVTREVEGNLPGMFDQRHAVNLDIAYRPGKTWQINLAWQYHSGRPYTEPVVRRTGSISYLSVDELYGETLPAYHRLDVRVNREIKTSHGEVSIFLEIINLYDRKNLRTYEYDLAQNSDQTGYYLEPEKWYWLGMTPSVGVSWRVDW